MGRSKTTGNTFSRLVLAAAKATWSKESNHRSFKKNFEAYIHAYKLKYIIQQRCCVVQYKLLNF
jgi:hypothetical protein